MQQENVFLTDRGTLTIPASIRKELGLSGGQHLIASTNKNGEIILRPAILVPVEIYTEERINEFGSQDIELGKLLDSRIN